MVLVGIGSNQGQSTGIVRAAIARLADCARPSTFRASRLWRTSPVDCPPDSGDFINAAVSFAPQAGLTPESLLQRLKAMEREFGREQTLIRNAPRALDLDLLVYGAELRATDEFTLPHPRATRRLFVLAPAAEVAPDLCWPGLGLTVQALLDGLRSDERVEPLED